MSETVEHFAPAVLEQSPPQFELEQPDDYSQYLLHSKSEIIAVLRSLVQKGALITVYFDQGKSFLLTSMIALDPDTKSFILDLGSNEEMNHRALLAKKLILTTVVDKVKIQFSVGGLAAAQFDGRSAFLGDIPEALLRLQRREYFRLSTPIAKPIKLAATIRRADGSALQVNLPLLDISGGGIALAVQAEEPTLQPYKEFTGCQLHLPDSGPLSVRLMVKSLHRQLNQNGSESWRAGCQFTQLPRGADALIQRYIFRLERQRSARERGAA